MKVRAQMKMSMKRIRILEKKTRKELGGRARLSGEVAGVRRPEEEGDRSFI